MELNIGTPLTSTAKKVVLLGSGELAKEVVIEFQRLGVEVIAVDRYPNAPAMQVAHRSHVINMLDPVELRKVIELENPDYIVPEIEAISTDTLLELENEGYKIVPSAKATSLTMNREGIRRLVAEKLNINTSDYRFADTQQSYERAVLEIGFPCVVKPVMSSSGKGQSTVKSFSDISKSWHHAITESRADLGKVIVERFVDFDFEITLITVRHNDGVLFCEPIGHRQENGDYQESWQPQNMSINALTECKRIAEIITLDLGGNGVFGVEFFIKGDIVYFSEISPRPHDTGMVTMISQDLSEFALHVRAILGVPITDIRNNGPSASSVILVKGTSNTVSFKNLKHALNGSDTQIRLFGKPDVQGERRMGVILALSSTVNEARLKANLSASLIEYDL
jgi:phosphoribosylglycinamide formyltransferase 2